MSFAVPEPKENKSFSDPNTVISLPSFSSKNGVVSYVQMMTSKQINAMPYHYFVCGHLKQCPTETETTFIITYYPRVDPEIIWKLSPRCAKCVIQKTQRAFRDLEEKFIKTYQENDHCLSGESVEDQLHRQQQAINLFQTDGTISTKVKRSEIPHLKNNIKLFSHLTHVDLKIELHEFDNVKLEKFYDIMSVYEKMHGAINV